MANPISVDRLIADYINRFPDNWDDGSMNLHVSEMGRCRRAVMYRLSRAERVPPTPQKTRMFHLGHYLHGLHYRALEHGKVLYRKEQRLEWPELGLVGRYDYLRMIEQNDDSMLMLGDDKTSHPNYLKYVKDFPKAKDMLQVSIYHWKLLETLEKRLRGDEINYMDRGGSNPSLVCTFRPIPYEETMDVVNQHRLDRDLLPDLPDPIEQGLNWSYRDKWGGGKLSYGPLDWQCGYCDYKVCPQWQAKQRMVVKITSTYGYQWTSFGRSLLRKNPQRMSDFIFGHQRYLDLLVASEVNLLPDRGAKVNTKSEEVVAGKKVPKPPREEEGRTEAYGEYVESTNLTEEPTDTDPTVRDNYEDIDGADGN